jgi:hypothetical protein
MKFVEPLPFADPDAAARKLVEIAPVSKRCRTAAASMRGEARDKAPPIEKPADVWNPTGGRYKANVTAFRTATLRR